MTVFQQRSTHDSLCISGIDCLLNSICRSYSETPLDLRDKRSEGETKYVYYCYYANCDLTQQAYLGFSGRDEKYY